MDFLNARRQTDGGIAALRKMLVANFLDTGHILQVGGVGFFCQS